ncbi:MAG: hypothetical protein ACHREM_22285 [Polyangiales bacterium]
MRLPERDLADSVIDLAAPLLQPLGPTPPIEDARRAIDIAIRVWNAHVTASRFWGNPIAKPLTELRKAMRGDRKIFSELSERWRRDFAFDPRLVGEWSYELTDDLYRLVCETTLPKGVEAAVPPPAEKRIAIGGRFLDEVRIRLSATSYLGFPIEHHRGVVGVDGAATVYAQMPSVVQLFAQGTLPPIGGRPVDITIGVNNLGPMVLREVRCTGDGGRYDMAVLVFQPAPARSGTQSGESRS